MTTTNDKIREAGQRYDDKVSEVFAGLPQGLNTSQAWKAARPHIATAQHELDKEVLEARRADPAARLGAADAARITSAMQAGGVSLDEIEARHQETLRQISGAQTEPGRMYAWGYTEASGELVDGLRQDAEARADEGTAGTEHPDRPGFIRVSDGGPYRHVDSPLWGFKTREPAADREAG